MAITVKNDTSGQAIGAVGLSAGIDKNRAYRLNLDQQEIQRQQLAAQQKASEQRFQEYKDRLIREDKMNEREAEIKARTLEAAARESEANLAMQKERLDLERANSEAAAGRADANIDIQRQQLAQNSNANQMALHQQKLSYTQEAENAKIDEALRRIQSDVASGRLSPAAAKEMTRQLNDKRYGTNTPQEEPTLAEQYAMETFTNDAGITLGRDSSGKFYDVDGASKQKEAEMQLKKEELKQKDTEAKYKIFTDTYKALGGETNEDGTPLYSHETKIKMAKEAANSFGDAGISNTQSGGAVDQDAATFNSIVGTDNPTTTQETPPTGQTQPDADPNRSETGALKHIGVTNETPNTGTYNNTMSNADEWKVNWKDQYVDTNTNVESKPSVVSQLNGTAETPKAPDKPKVTYTSKTVDEQFMPAVENLIKYRGKPDETMMKNLENQFVQAAIKAGDSPEQAKFRAKVLRIKAQSENSSIPKLPDTEENRDAYLAVDKLHEYRKQYKNLRATEDDIVQDYENDPYIKENGSILMQEGYKPTTKYRTYDELTNTQGKEAYQKYLDTIFVKDAAMSVQDFEDKARKDNAFLWKYMRIGQGYNKERLKKLTELHGQAVSSQARGIRE